MSSQSEGYPAHMRAFWELLIRLRSDLCNALDKVLILSITAERLYETSKALGAQYAHQTGARERSGINAVSVALDASMPRETARRRIAAPVEKRLLGLRRVRNLSQAAPAAGDLATGTATTLNYIRSVTRDARSWA